MSVKKTKITDNKRQQSFSRRAAQGKLEVIKSDKLSCPHCGHNKFLDTLAGKTKCSRCKRGVNLSELAKNKSI